MEKTSADRPAIGTTRPTVPAWQGLALGLVAGALVWAVVQAVHPVFLVPEQFHIAGIGAPVEEHVAFRREQDRLDQWHAMLYLGALGLTIGLLAGARLALARRSAWRILLAPGLAAPLGVAGGALSGYLAPQIYVWARDQVGHIELLQIIGAQALVGAPLGLLLGLGLGLMQGGISGGARGMVAGALGGTLFAIVYPLFVAVALPAANTEVLLPEEPLTRLAWLGLLGACVGLLAFPSTVSASLKSPAASQG